MTQVAGPETILAPFDGSGIRSHGQTFTFLRRADSFFVRMADPLWQKEFMIAGGDPRDVSAPPQSERRVVMTTGSHNAQYYWVEGVRPGEPIRIPAAFLAQEGRLIPYYDALLQPPARADERHSYYWDPRFGLWNRACSMCHSLAANPGLDLATGNVNTEITEFGITCESCHGPGKDHVNKHLTTATESSSTLADTQQHIFHPQKATHQASTHMCGRCHAEFIHEQPNDYLVNGLNFLPGDNLEDWVKVSYFGDGKADWTLETYWPDGTQRVSGDEFLGTTASACYLQGQMSCLSCHSMHQSDRNDMLAERMDGNEACLQCHESMRDRITSHTHHASDSSGSSCYNCHMPHTAYAFLKAQRTHRIDSPNVQNTLDSGKPNACNLCHLDKTLQWTAGHLTEWYRAPRVELETEDREIAASLLWLLRGDAGRRALAAWHFSWPPAIEASGDDWQAPFLAYLLEDPYSAVRFIAGRSLRQLPALEALDYDFLADPEVREEAKRQVLKHWQQNLEQPSGLLREQILIGADGRVHEREVNRLLQSQDGTPVRLFE